MGYSSCLVYGLCALIAWGSIKFEDPILNIIYIWFISAIMIHLKNEKGFLIFGFVLILINVGIVVVVVGLSALKGL